MKFLLLFCILVIAAGCAPNGNSITAITSIPQAAIAPTASPAATVMLQTQATPAPTSALAALVAQAGTPIEAPLDNDLPVGNAMQIAAATDTMLRSTPRNPMTFDANPVPITFDEFYDGYDLRTGLLMSDKLLSLDAQSVIIEGYMAPPLKPELDYFVLTRIRLAFCPFCSTASDWPDDIALVYLPEETTTATLLPVRVTGRIEIGASVDQETGMVSLVRIYADDLETLN